MHSRSSAAPDRPFAGRRRTVLLLATAALLLGYLVVLSFWTGQRHAEGWAGISYQGYMEGDEDLRDMPMMGHFLVGDGEILMVHAGSTADAAGLRRGQRIVSIDGVSTEDQEALEELAARVGRGDVLTYRIAEADGSEKDVAVRLGSPFQVPNLLIGISVNTLVGLGYLAISLLVVWGRPRSPQAMVFYLLCTAGAAFFFFFTLVELDMQGSRGLLSNVQQNAQVLPYLMGYPILGLLLSNLLLHLILIFPRRRPLVEAHPEVLAWLHTVPFLPGLALATLFLTLFLGKTPWLRWSIPMAAGLVLAALLIRLLRLARRSGARTAVRESPFATQGAVIAMVAATAPLMEWIPEDVAAPLFGLTLAGTMLAYVVLVPVVYLFLCLIPLIRNYREAGVEEKRQLRWPLWGTGTSLGLGALLFLTMFVCGIVDPELVHHSWWAPVGSATFKLLNLLIPVSFGIAIAKYRLMDIDAILRKTAVYGATSAVVVAVYLLLVGGVGLTLLRWTRVENQVVVVAATLVLAALFVPVRNRVQGWVDRGFGRGGPDRADALEQVRRAVVGSPDLATLLPRVAETVQQAVGTRTLVLFVQQPERSHLVARAKVGLPDELLGRLSLDPAPLAAAGRVAPVDELEWADDDREALRRVRADLVAPARRQAEVVGAVVAGRKLDGSDTGADDRDLLAAVADQLALAVGSLGTRRETLELDQARVLQRSLLPERVPEVAGVELAAVWRPAREVAGDYYDLLDLGDGRLALCIGDVAGKGMSAALLMSSLQAAVRAVAAPEVAPEQVCEQVRRVVTRNLTGGLFVTFFYALLDVPRRRLDYCNAGHAPPLVARAGGALEWLETGGGAFARLLADTPLEGGHVELRAGDRLVLYTDGITEARRPGGEMLGEEGLAEQVRGGPDGDSASATSRRLLAAVADHSGPVAGDDVTLVVARLEAVREVAADAAAAAAPDPP